MGVRVVADLLIGNFEGADAFCLAAGLDAGAQFFSKLDRGGDVIHDDFRSRGVRGDDMDVVQFQNAQPERLNDLQVADAVEFERVGYFREDACGCDEALVRNLVVGGDEYQPAPERVCSSEQNQEVNPRAGGCRKVQPDAEWDGE